MNKINVGIVGATGYAGEALIEILLRHEGVRIAYLCAKIDEPKPISVFFPRFKNRCDSVCHLPDVGKLIEHCELIFLALPHTVSMEVVPALLKAGKKVIDLSADYRLRDTAVYQKFYKVAHRDASGLKAAVYGLPELYRVKIKNASLIANPGCYPTAAILALAPVLALDSALLDSVIIDAKSGVTGAGRKVAAEFLFPEINEDFMAYKVNVHQHSPEIDQELSKAAAGKVKVTFVPHLLPLNRGILETIYLKTDGSCRHTTQSLLNLYRKFYKNEPFVRIKDEGMFPKLKDVVDTNFCDIGIRVDGARVIIVSAIDNLLKGASGQAVHNFNIMYGFPERTAL